MIIFSCASLKQLSHEANSTEYCRTGNIIESKAILKEISSPWIIMYSYLEISSYASENDCSIDFHMKIIF